MIRKQKRLGKEKQQFKSYYCGSCRQRKSCQQLSRENCCSCAYEREVEKAQEYLSTEKVLAEKQAEQQTRIQQLKLLRGYLGCQECGSLAVDACDLYDNNKLVCWTCLIEKTGGASGVLSWVKESKWYQKRWEINLGEWLDTYNCLPINANCAKKCLKDSQHLSNCACLEEAARQSYELFANSLREKQDKLKKCVCEMSEKVRVSSDDYAWCEKCNKGIAAASKKRVIKNRNDPQFWGLKVQEKVLCGNCLKNLVGKMPARKKYTFNKYVKRGYWK